jgi:hypothetical protein
MVALGPARAEHDPLLVSFCEWLEEGRQLLPEAVEDTLWTSVPVLAEGLGKKLFKRRLLDALSTLHFPGEWFSKK